MQPLLHTKNIGYAPIRQICTRRTQMDTARIRAVSRIISLQTGAVAAAVLQLKAKEFIADAKYVDSDYVNNVGVDFFESVLKLIENYEEDRNALIAGQETLQKYIAEQKEKNEALRWTNKHLLKTEKEKRRVCIGGHGTRGGNLMKFSTKLISMLLALSMVLGYFPGVTVDRKDGTIKGYPETLVTDLPGIYSMSPYSSEELVSRNFVLENAPNGIINIIDATNIERNLYLTLQLLEMDRPMVVAVNMMDELTGNGGSIDVNVMEEMLGVPVVPISAAKNSGVDELITHAIHVAEYQETPVRKDLCPIEDHDGAVHRCIHSVMHLIQDHAQKANIPLRFATSKVIEGDSHIIEKLNLDDNEIETIEHLTIQMENERKLDRSAAIADMRFSYIEKICKNMA